MPADPEDMLDQQTTLAPDDDGEPAADPDAEPTLDSTGLAGADRAHVGDGRAQRVAAD